MDQKLIDLKNSLLDSIQQTFRNYKQESRAILDQTMLSTTQIISKALIKDEQNNETDTDLRVLIKKALTHTMTLQDVGIFDNGILNYYRHYATPIEQITISSLKPLKIGLHFTNIYIEGMVCDDQFDNNDAKFICRIFHNSTSTSTNARFTGSISYDQTNPACQFKTNYVNELIPCTFILSSLKCTLANKTMKDCTYQRTLNTVSHGCQSDEHINVFC
jgi:hypothetical protein